MPDSGLWLFPASAKKMWQEHPWHREIADFRLPEKQLLSISSARITASCYLGPEQAQGGVYTARGEYVPSSRHLRRNKDLTAGNPEVVSSAKNIPRLPGRYLYLGWFFNHYGHFVLESLSRAWALPEADPVDGYLMHLHAPNYRPANYLLAFFDLLAIPREKLILVEEEMQVEELLLPSQQAVLSRSISSEMLDLYRHLGEQAAICKGESHAGKLYISRRFLPADQRGASNEKALEERFQEEGYVVIHPQFMDVPSQLALFSGATDFAGLEGSGLHNILFAREPRSVWMLGAESQLADAITQVELGRQCHCRTELHLQAVPDFSGLHPRVTPLLINPQDSDSPRLSGVKVTAYDRFLWLSALAAQLQRKACSKEGASANGQLSEAEAKLLRALPLAADAQDPPAADPENSNELFGFLRAEQDFVRGDNKAALRQMEQHLPQYQTHAAFLFRYAQMLDANQHGEQALEVAARALRLDPVNPGLVAFHARLLSEQNHMQDALARLGELANTFPRCFPLKIQLAEMLAKTGSFGEAADLLESLIRDSEKHQSLLPRLTWYLFRAGHHDAAEKTAHEALEQAPGNPFSFIHLARIHLARKQPGAALEWVDQAIEDSPEKKDLQQLRQKIIEMLAGESG
ncbi:glycosyltransferase 61 family protein [Thiolapillus sp.]